MSSARMVLMNSEAPSYRPSTRPAPVIFSAVLEPNRSASVRNLNTAVLIFALGSLPFCVMFWFLGAWPVVGFVGVDVLILACLLRIHHWAGRAREVIHLTEKELTVERISHWGRVRQVSLSPNWLRVRVEDIDDYRNRLEIANRDETHVIGNFLSRQEKIELADALRRGLDQLTGWSPARI